MNLKESFRYQRFLDNMLQAAIYSIQNRNRALKTTRTHFRSKANPAAEDITETVESEERFFPNDDVIRFMQHLVDEKDKLSTAISDAKASADFKIDAAVEVNKFNRSMASAMKSMLRLSAYRKTEQGRDYKFDVNGVQSPYFYDIETVAEEAFDRDMAKTIMRNALEDADRISADIDTAMVTIQVEYVPPYNVNDSFDDAMEEFLASAG